MATDEAGNCVGLVPRHVDDTELQFLSRYLKDDDLDTVRSHLYDVWRAVVAGPAPVYLCIRELMFVQPRLRHNPFYSEALQLLQTARKIVPRPIWLDIGCAFGTDVRQLRLDGLAAEEVVALDLTPDYWRYGLQLYRDADLPPCAAIFGDITSDVFLPPTPSAAIAPASDVTTNPGRGEAEFSDGKERALEGASSISIGELVGAVQVVSCTAVLHCLPQQSVQPLLKKAALLLRPGGVLIGNTLGAITPREWEAAYQAGNRRWLHSAESLAHALREAGLEEVEVQVTSYESRGNGMPSLERMESHVGRQLDVAERRVLAFKARKSTA